MAIKLTVSGYRQRIWVEHADIVDAIEAHDVTRASAAAQAHTHAASVVVLKNIDTVANRDLPQVDADMLLVPR